MWKGNMILNTFQMGGLAKSPLAGLAALGLGGLGPASTGGLNPAGKYDRVETLAFLKYKCCIIENNDRGFNERVRQCYLDGRLNHKY